MHHACHVSVIKKKKKKNLSILEYILGKARTFTSNKQKSDLTEKYRLMDKFPPSPPLDPACEKDSLLFPCHFDDDIVSRRVQEKILQPQQAR